MKTMLLSENEELFYRVYSEEQRAALQRDVGTDGVLYTKEQVLQTPSQARYVFSTWGMPAFTEEEIRTYFPRLEAVFYAAGSVQGFARPFLNCGVKVFSAWAANAVPVAEFTVAQILLANKGFYRLARMANRNAAEYEAAWSVREQFPGNYGTKVGIVGAGMIGKLVIRLLKAYELEVLVFDPFLPEETAAQLGVEKVPLERLFTECQVVSNHLADNAQTKGMLTGALFSRLRPGATFLNTGRGAQVVESELVQVLREREDLTAVLDVCVEEPPAAEVGFYGLPNCILTPHMAGSSGDEVHRLAAYMLEEFENYTHGRPCRFEVTQEMLQTMA